MHGRRRTGTFSAQNDGLKYACELLPARLIVPMVNIGMKNGATTCKAGGSMRVMTYRSQVLCGAVTAIAAKG
jgi:hypothetical protein